MPWVIGGDFNEILQASEKTGSSGPLHQMEAFIETLDYCGMHDLGFIGYRFTWSNGRIGDQNVQECLDRFVGNSQWIGSF